MKTYSALTKVVSCFILSYSGLLHIFICLQKSEIIFCLKIVIFLLKTQKHPLEKSLYFVLI